MSDKDYIDQKIESERKDRTFIKKFVCAVISIVLAAISVLAINL